jgi:hypothetical protein
MTRFLSLLATSSARVDNCTNVYHSRASPAAEPADRRAGPRSDCAPHVPHAHSRFTQPPAAYPFRHTTAHPSNNLSPWELFVLFGRVRRLCRTNLVPHRCNSVFYARVVAVGRTDLNCARRCPKPPGGVLDIYGNNRGFSSPRLEKDGSAKNVLDIRIVIGYRRPRLHFSPAPWQFIRCDQRQCQLTRGDNTRCHM